MKQEKVVMKWISVPKPLLQETHHLCLEALSLAGLPPGVRKRFRVLVGDIHLFLHKEDVPDQMEFDL